MGGVGAFGEGCGLGGDGDKPRGPRISAEKHAIITDELARLNPNTAPSAEELRTQALSQAIWRTPEDLRTWLRHQVTTANKNNPNPIEEHSEVVFRSDEVHDLRQVQ